MSKKTIKLEVYRYEAGEKMHLHENLKRIRKDKGLNQEQLAERSGISKGQLSKLETGEQSNPVLQTVVALSAALGVSIEELVFGEGGPNEMQYLLNAIEKMPKDKQRTIKELIVAFIAQSTADQLRNTV